MPVKRNYPNFDVSGLNKWGVPNYKSVMTVKGKPPKVVFFCGNNKKIKFKYKQPQRREIKYSLFT